MSKTKFKFRRGLTLAELVVTMAISAIVIFGVGVLMVDTQRGWHVMYDRIYSDVVTDSYVARKSFDSVIRKASTQNHQLDADGEWIEVYYYADSNSAVLDRYARFYTSNGLLNLECGSLNPKQTLLTKTLCQNVTNCVFETEGKSAQMVLTLDNGLQSMTVTTSAVMHN